MYTYKKAIETLYELENKYQYPKIKLQCALKYLDPKRNSFSKNPCDMVTESFGLMHNGILLASPWAIGHNGKPINEEFVLGNLLTTRMEAILQSNKVKNFILRSDENFGHCKMQSYFSQSNNAEKAFSKDDPLCAAYNEEVSTCTQKK